MHASTAASEVELLDRHVHIRTWFANRVFLIEHLSYKSLRLYHLIPTLGHIQLIYKVASMVECAKVRCYVQILRIFLYFPAEKPLIDITSLSCPDLEATSIDPKMRLQGRSSETTDPFRDPAPQCKQAFAQIVSVRTTAH